MGFMQSYKRLDKLCRECYDSDSGVKYYIEYMDSIHAGSRYVHTWQDDYKKLKRYRFIRNQISHDPDCNEDNLCVPEDAEWLDDFYQRIIDGTDPLTLYRKTTGKTAEAKKSRYVPSAQAYQQDMPKTHDASLAFDWSISEQSEQTQKPHIQKKRSATPQRKELVPYHFKFSALDWIVAFFILVCIALFLFALLTR
ncbi:MAG: hypothetical protein IJ960_04655 [Oscillospiraceae bacterium]|nr:hypothetical protein [Oscillospiraceae bacterium]